MKRTLIAEKKEVTESSNHIFKLFFTSLLLISMTSFGKVKLPQLIQDGMVLQRDARVKIWGWASVGEKVALHFNNQSFNAVTGKDEKWEITLPAQKAGGPFTMDCLLYTSPSPRD